MSEAADRFWRNVAPPDPETGCREWQRARNTGGYGIAVDCRMGRKMAHRRAWELANGPILDGLFVLHKCDNPACCNPDHLFLGTHQDNMDDMVAKGRSLRGRRHLRVFTLDRLTELIVRVRRGETIAEAARNMGVSYETAWRAYNRRKP